MSTNERKGRHYTTVPLVSKLNALSDIEKGVPISKIAKKLGLHQSTIRTWRKNKETLKKFHNEHSDEFCANRSRVRKTVNDQVDKATWIWYKESWIAGTPLSGPIIRAQALKFHSALGRKENFHASEGWLSKWKSRHNIRSIALCSEKLSADTPAAEKFKLKFLDFIKTEGVVADQIFNCDEMGFNYKMLPQCTPLARTENGAPGMKKNKECITVMACSNASGSLKLPLMVIGKSTKPEILKNLSKLPVYYKSQQSAWMDSDLFKTWFHEEFVPRVTQLLEEKQLPVKAILFIDNCRAHAVNLNHGDIKTIIFSPNTTGLIRSMSQELLKCLKTNYRKKFMFSMLNHLNSGESLMEYLKIISMKDAIYWLALAWDEISPLTITKSWNTILPRDDYQKMISVTNEPYTFPVSNTSKIKVENNNGCDMEVTDVGIQINFPEQLQQFHQFLLTVDEFKSIEFEDVNEWINNSMKNNPDEYLSDEDVIRMVTDMESIDDLGEDEEESRDKVSHDEAKKALDTLIKYCDYNSNFVKEDLKALHRIKGVMIVEAMEKKEILA